MVCSNHLGPKVRILSQMIAQYIDRSFSMLDLTSTQAFVLRYLTDHASEPVYSKDIEKRFHLTHPTVSGVLQRLEAKEYITVTPDPHDRRCKRITMTDRAKQCNLEIVKTFSNLQRDVTAGMSEDDCAELMRLLDLAVDNLKQFEPKEDSPQ